MPAYAARPHTASLPRWGKIEQGRSNRSGLSARGLEQARRCEQALSAARFDACLASPLERAARTARVVWGSRDAEGLAFVDALAEVDLGAFSGLTNADAKERFPREYRAWRCDPANFSLPPDAAAAAGAPCRAATLRYPVRELWGEAHAAWAAVLAADGDDVLVVTHKSLLRGMLCVALGLGPASFRAFDVDNGGCCVVHVDALGAPAITAVNATAHLEHAGVRYLAGNDECEAWREIEAAAPPAGAATAPPRRWWQPPQAHSAAARREPSPPRAPAADRERPE